MAVIRDACALLTAATSRTSPVNSKSSNGAAERAVRAVEEMVRTLRLDFLHRTNFAVGSDLPITSWIVRHAAWLVSHFQASIAEVSSIFRIPLRSFVVHVVSALASSSFIGKFSIFK